MSRPTVFLILMSAALLEAAGDAMIRKGIHAATLPARAALYLCAALALFAYGWLVNRAPWSFGALFGIYIVLFFVMAQILGALVFGDKLTAPVMAGGALIVAGGVVITFWR